ncbi:MAG: bifunctional riboflavin kinase/FAD synthetase [bacterium]|nr:bifunctional riboflavin kinase/FAD synthetase [Gammaproteobacteria bacterium]HIL95190.1 bifunctional riboflavin kinase/FAD synthetase [Pseudomonadales bacterium]
MEIIRGLVNLKPRHRGCVVTIGNFDGVHLGHQAILKRIRERARELAVRSMLICFEPLPKEFFGQAPARLTRFRERVLLLEEVGVDLVLCLRFDEKTRSLSAQDFMNILVKDIEICGLYVGDDFRFGNDRSGSFGDLQAAGQKHGFDVTNLHTLTFEDVRVSSTRIRECLAAGEFEEAEQMLGHAYSITGRVVYGRQLGRTLGAPTLNIQLHRYRAAIDGVYAVEVEGLDKRYRGVANVGVRPTLNEETVKPILEVHLFDFNQDVYGKNVEVIFRHRIRPEKKFAGLDELKEAIATDVIVARQFFTDRQSS